MNLSKQLYRISLITFLLFSIAPAISVLAQNPQINSLSPSIGLAGNTITINGSGFYADDWPSRIEFDGSIVGSTPVSSSQIRFVIPENADCIGMHEVQVINPNRPDGGGRLIDSEFSNIVELEVACPLELEEFVPRYSAPGDRVLVLGQGFKAGIGLGEVPIGQSYVRFAGDSMPTTFVSSTELEFIIPTNATCGPNRVEVANPPLLGQVFGREVMSNSIDFNVFCISSLDPVSAPPGTGVEILGGGFGPPGNVLFQIIGESKVHFDGDEINTQFLGSTRLSFRIPQNASCGAHEILVHNLPHNFVGEALDSNTLILNVTGLACDQQQPQPPDNGGGNNNGGRDLPSDYDTSGDCFLSDQEFFAAVDDWIAERIDNPFFFRIVDSWIANEQVCFFASSSELAVSLRANSAAIYFVTQQDARLIEVEIFNLEGDLVNKLQSAGSALTWNQRTSSGSPVANGVYLYVVSGVDVNGRVLRSDVQKLVLMR